MKILVVNAGSSSLKYQLIDMEHEQLLVKGNCERIGAGGAISHKVPGREPYKAEYPMPTHDEAIGLVLQLLVDPELGVIQSVDEIDAVGHRIAHGGEKYKRSTRIDDEVLRYLEGIVPINPLHGPPAILGIRACMKQMASTPQIGVFDTSFYSEIADYRYIYPLPYSYYEDKKIRRYGFQPPTGMWRHGRPSFWANRWKRLKSSPAISATVRRLPLSKTASPLIPRWALPRRRAW